MLYVADATFLTFMAEIDVQALGIVRPASIQAVLDEARHNLKDEIKSVRMAECVAILESKAAKTDSAFRNLSPVDASLLETCTQRKRECVLVTDDGLLMAAARNRHIAVLSTPAFIEFLAKKDVVERRTAVAWLEKLSVTYPRTKKVETALKNLEGIKS
ncbi:hypothetical protein HY572_04295 [Candidatus Micrarchaeota archaeon]|nr:hypothetical protein [Candidatus Micrarchaeota archaeon]